MLLYEQLDTFVVRPQNILEPVERFVKRHLAYAADQIVGIGDDLFFRCQRQIIFPRKSEPNRFSCGNACADVSLNDKHELLWKTKLSRDLNPCNRMFNAVRPGPADVMKQTALPDQFPINRDFYTPGKGNRCGNGNTVLHDIPGATSSD